MKIISSGKGLYSQDFYKKKQKARRTKLFASSFLLLAFLIAVILFFRWEKFLISEVVIAEDIAVDRQAIAEVINAELSGYYLYLIPKNNAIIFRRGAMKDKLIETFPRFTSLDLNLEGFNKLVVSASERDPFALYCVEVEKCL